MGVNHRFVATRLLGFALIGGCALLTICPTRTMNGAKAAEAQTANAGELAKRTSHRLRFSASTSGKPSACLVRRQPSKPATV
jgi:hypothetical protein